MNFGYVVLLYLALGFVYTAVEYYIFKDEIEDLIVGVPDQAKNQVRILGHILTGLMWPISLCLLMADILGFTWNKIKNIFRREPKHVILRIPEDYPTIGAAIEAMKDKDVSYTISISTKTILDEVKEKNGSDSSNPS